MTHFFTLYYYLLFESLSHPLMVFHWSLSDCKSSKVSRTLLSTLADLNNALVWMISTLPLIFKSSSLFNNPSMTVPRAPIIIGKNVTFIFHSFFNSLATLRYLFFFSLIIIIIIPLKILHTSVTWWSSTGVWVTASLLNSPRLFSVFWPIFIKL